MKAWRLLLISASLIMAAGAAAFAQEKIGEAVYMEGGISLTRDSQQLDSSEVQTGLEIQNFDVMKTGGDGAAEVSVDNPRVPAMTIKVSPGTQFSFELSRLGSRQQTSVGLVGGSISMKVSKLSGMQELNVGLDNAVMGVRGTEFTVTSLPSGDLLVVCKSGDVVLTDENGKEIHAVPGTAIERLAGMGFTARPVGLAGPDDFRKAWEDARIVALKTGAFSVIQREAIEYNRLVDEFDETYAALQEKKDILDRWEAEEKSGAPAAGAAVEKEKAEIADLLADLRETQFLLERVRFRLARLEEFHAQGLGDGEISKGVTTAAFFERFDKDRPDLLHRLAMARFVAKMYVHRNDGSDPTMMVNLHKFYERRLVHLKRLGQHKRIVKRDQK